MTSLPGVPGSTVSGRPDLRHLSLLWALQEHAGEIASLHASLFEKSWDEVSVGRLLAHPGSLALTAGLGTPRRLGGFALAQIAADEAEILTIGVIPDWQRQGIGTRLVEGVKRAAARAGAGRLFLEVARSNAPARALYAKLGFVESGVRKGYYQSGAGPAEDAIVLSVELPKSKA